MVQTVVNFVGKLIEHFSSAIVGVVAEYFGKSITDSIQNTFSSSSFMRDLNKVTSLFLSSNVKIIFLDEKTLGIIEAIKEQILHFKNNENEVILNFLFVGPPGTGKTHSMRIIEHFIRKNKIKSKCFFLPGSFFRQYTEEKAIESLSALFIYINKLVSEGYFVILFVDEIESLLGNYQQTGRSDVINLLLTNISNLMDKTLNKGGKFSMIGSTNHPNIIDLAFGRRLKTIFFPVPDSSTKVLILKYYLQKYKSKNQTINIEEDFLENLVLLEDRLTGSDLENIAKNKLILTKKKNITAYDILEELFNVLITKYQIEYKFQQSQIIVLTNLFEKTLKQFKETNEIDLLELKKQIEKSMIL